MIIRRLKGWEMLQVKRSLILLEMIGQQNLTHQAISGKEVPKSGKWLLW
jgi:hypothetical protein